MKNEHEKRRRNYFIDKEFQAKFILKFCALAALGALISAFIVYKMSVSTVTTTFENSRLVMKTTADFILPAVCLSTFVFIIFVGLATVAITLFTSHKIAGPLYRMEKDIEEVSGGNLKKRFNLREHDEIKRLAASLDKMTETLRSDINELKECVTELESSAPGADLKEKIEKLKAVLKKFIT